MSQGLSKCHTSQVTGPPYGVNTLTCDDVDVMSIIQAASGIRL